VVFAKMKRQNVTGLARDCLLDRHLVPWKTVLEVVAVD